MGRKRRPRPQWRGQNALDTNVSLVETTAADDPSFSTQGSGLRMQKATGPALCVLANEPKQMSDTDRVYWTLAEASAWVVFRDTSIVALFGPPEPFDWVAYMMYPTHWTAPEVGQQLEVFAALARGRLVATGRSEAPNALRQNIPAEEWLDLVPDIRGPYLRLADGRTLQPWQDILVRRADVERLWRRTSEVDGRSKFSKVWFRDRYLQFREAQPASSKNELIAELQAQFQDETKREPPSRSSIQSYLKGL